MLQTPKQIPVNLSLFRLGVEQSNECQRSVWWDSRREFRKQNCVLHESGMQVECNKSAALLIIYYLHSQGEAHSPKLFPAPASGCIPNSGLDKIVSHWKGSKTPSSSSPVPTAPFRDISTRPSIRTGSTQPRETRTAPLPLAFPPRWETALIGSR